MNLRKLHFTMICAVSLCCGVAVVLLAEAFLGYLKGTGDQSGVAIAATAVLVACASVIVAVYQHRQTKTLDLLHAINLDASTARNIARAVKFGEDNYSYLTASATPKEDIKTFVEKDESLSSAILCTLGTFDDLAISVRAGITEEDILRISFHGLALRLFETYYQYISALREIKRDPSMYIPLQWLYAKWIQKHDYNGNRKLDLNEVLQHIKKYDLS